MAYLAALAKELEALRQSGAVSGGVQLINLSPVLRNSDAYACFGSSVGVMEFPQDFWEQPAGLGLCPLDVICNICSNIHTWLTLSPGNVVVLHARTCTRTERQLAHFVAACHLIYSTWEVDNMHLAVDSLLDANQPSTAHSLLFGFHGSDGGGSGALAQRPGNAAARGLLQGEWRYGEYLSTLLHHTATMPPTVAAPLLLQKVVCSKLGCFAAAAAATDGGSPRKSPRKGAPRRLGTITNRTLMAVFQRGQRVWSEGESLASFGEGDDTVVFTTNLVLRCCRWPPRGWCAGCWCTLELCCGTAVRCWGGECQGWCRGNTTGGGGAQPRPPGARCGGHCPAHLHGLSACGGIIPTLLTPFLSAFFLPWHPQGRRDPGFLVSGPRRGVGPPRPGLHLPHRLRSPWGNHSVCPPCGCSRPACCPAALPVTYLCLLAESVVAQPDSLAENPLPMAVWAATGLWIAGSWCHCPCLLACPWPGCCACLTMHGLCPAGPSCLQVDVPGSSPAAVQLAEAEGFFMHLLLHEELPEGHV